MCESAGSEHWQQQRCLLESWHIRAQENVALCHLPFPASEPKLKFIIFTYACQRMHRLAPPTFTYYLILIFVASSHSLMMILN